MVAPCLFPALISSGFYGKQGVFLPQSAQRFAQGAQRGYGEDWCSTTFKLPRRLTETPLLYSAIQEIPRYARNDEGEFSHNDRGWQCRQAMRTRWCGFSRFARNRPADLTFCFFLVKQKEEKKKGRAGGISISLEFLVLFFQEKSTEDNYNPVNMIAYGQPGYTPPGANMNFSRGFDHSQWSLGADGEFDDYIFSKFNEQEYVRKVGSKKLMWMSKKAAASGGIVAGALGKFITGIYAGKFHGVNVFETNLLGTLEESKEKKSGGVTLPPLGIIVGKGVKSKGYDEDLLMHEFGHKLQYDLVGFENYYNIIAINSSLSAYQDGKDGWKHKDYWTETWANYLSREYFGSSGWNNWRFPAQNISHDSWLKFFNY